MKNERKALVVLTPGFAASEADTTCLPMQQDFLRALKKLHPQLDIIVLAFQYPYIVSTYSWHGIRVITFNGRNRGGLRRWMLRWKINAALKKISREKNIVGLLSFWYGECAVVGRRFGKKKGISHGCWVLGQDARKTNSYPARYPPDPNELIALSDFLQGEFERNHGVRPATVITPGINKDRFIHKDVSRDIDVLGVGSLIPLKQYNFFIQVVAQLKYVLPGISAVLVGAGTEKKRLEEYAETLGLQQNLRFTGELPYDEVLQLMQRSKLLLHPSSYEGYSGVCMEALAAGAQVMSFCRALNEEIENWHIVQDKGEMERKALMILQHEQLSYRPSIQFSVEASAEKMMKHFLLK
jgi:glycosyltransferase involved in cell wall biosynthesis